VTLDEVIDRPCAWFTDHDSAEIAISSRIRLARNVVGFPFPAMAKGPQREEIRKRLVEVLEALPLFQGGWIAGMEDLSELERALLFERSLISREHADNEKGSAVAVSADEQDVVMVNEEDHLRLQVVRPGLSLSEAWVEMEKLDDALEERVNYAFSETMGYMTSCPTNVGTGLRAGVMLHLPGLALMEEIRPVLRGLGKIGLAVRGLGGEGSEADGFLYQVSNQITLGRSETQIVGELEDIVRELIVHERNARIRLEEGKPEWLRDRVGRAVGLLQNAWVLSSKEALDMLALVRLGLAVELWELDEAHGVEQLMVHVRPAHLQRLARRELEAGERDRFRAEWVRSKLADLRKGHKLNLL